MEVLIEKKELVKALKKVEKAIPSKSFLSIFEGILLVAYDDTLKITCGDGDLIISTTIKDEEKEMLEVNRDGKIVVPAKMFINISKAMPDGEITLTTSDSNLVVKGGKSRFELTTTNPDEYPRLPDRMQKPTFTVNGVEFSDGLNKTVFVTAKDPTRPHFTGINIIGGEGTLTMNATDTHRLNRKNSIAYEGDGDSFEGIILPGKSAKEIAKLIKNCGKVDVYITDNLAIFKTEDDVIYSKLIAGNYPDVTKVIPQDFQITVTVSKAGLLSALERAMILAKEDKMIVTLEIGAENETIFESIKVYQRGNEIGKSNEIVAVDKVEGGEITISFNADYVIDALKEIDDERIEMKFSNSIRPFVIVGEETKNEFLQVIMPVRPY